MKKFRLLVIVLLFILAGIADTNRAEASVTKIYEQSYSKVLTEKQTDITGDGKKDIIRVNTADNESGDITAIIIFINGKAALSFHDIYVFGITIDSITLKSGQKLFYIETPTSNDDTDVSAIYRYDNTTGKLKGAAALLSQIDMWGKGVFHCYVKSIKTKGNNLVVSYYGQTCACGYTKWKYTYGYSNGKLNMKNRTVKPDGKYNGKKYKASKKLSFYKNTQLKRKAFTVNKGAEVKLKKICYKNKRFYLQFRYKGKAGWISAGKMDIFDGVILAG